jgi:predicted MFS family arabinose efflux permease
MLLAIPILDQSRSDGPRQHLDLSGALLGTGTIVILVLALSRLATPGADLLQVLLLALLSLILGLSFVLVERRHPHALVPLRIFRVRNLSSANLITLLGAAVASILAFVLTLYLQNVLGFTPLLTGLIFLPAGLGGIAGGQVAAWAIHRLGLRGAATLGAGLIALSSILMATISATSGVVQVTIGYTIAGIGVVSIMITTSIAGTAQLEPEIQGLAAGLLNTSQQIGQAIGLSLASLVAIAITLANGGSGKQAITTGYQAALYLTTGLALAAGTMALLTLRAHAAPTMSASVSDAARADTRPEHARVAR